MKYDKREWGLAVIILIAVLEIDSPITRWCQLVSTIALVSGMAYLATGFSLKTARDSIKFTGWLTSKGIEQGTKLLDNLELLKPNGFSFMPMPTMTMASAHESHAPVIRVFKQFGSSKEGDSDGDADNNSDKVERNQPDHEGKSAWEKVLAKFSELSARLDNLEAITYADPNNG